MSVPDFYIDSVYEGTMDFDCGFEVFNKYIRKAKPDDSAVLHYIINSENNDLIAYFSLLSSSLLFGENQKNLNSIPAIELKMFALNKQYQGKGLAPTLLNSVISVIRDYSLEYVGAKLILLYSVEIDYVVNLYEEVGFKSVGGLFTVYKNIFNEGCVPMYRLIHDGHANN